MLGSRALSVVHLTVAPGVASLNPSSARWPHSFKETDHEIISMVILYFLLIQEERLSVAGKNMCTKYCLIICAQRIKSAQEKD